MAERYRETDYLYGSARVRSMENRLVGRERLERLLEAHDSAAIMGMLEEYGFGVAEGTAGASREAILLHTLAEEYAELEKMTEGKPSPLRFLRYPYDCHNIKSLIKCFSRGVDAEDLLFYSLGTVDTDAIKQAFHEKDYHAFPTHMAEAIPVAEESFSQTGNPQTVDLILDGACYADMLDAAKDSGMSFAVRLVETKIDLINLMTCLRLIRIRAGEKGRMLLSEALLSGGTLPRDFFEDALASGEAAMAERLTYSRYAGLAPLLEAESELHTLEKWADDLWMSLAREANYIPFGAELLVGYAIALEYEIKNIRILLAGKDAELPSDVIRERMRMSYV